ncbi:MAG: hypothetical protein E6J39_06820 [Chloroflexi bacterium]|nr:MAG: hypothetical protein E6J39_06820 [Chloroflexota bacterium]
MGMHQGFIAADVPLDRLVAAINSHVSKLETREARRSLDEMDLEPKNDGWPMAIGERDGKAYILDTSLVLSSAHDLIPALSADLGGAIVVGAGAETTSGSYWLFAARNGKAIRSYWNCYTDMRQPWSKGEPLASEAAQHLEDLDGDGLRAAAASLGLDYDGWSRSGPFLSLFYSAETFPQAGPVAEEFNTFHASVRIPESQQPKPTAIRRDGGGVDLVPAGSPAALAAKPEKKGLFGLFGRK